MDLIKRTKIHGIPGTHFMLPIKYRFTEYYWFPEDYNSKDIVARITELEERLGQGMLILEATLHSEAVWYYRWTKINNLNKGYWIFTIYLTTDEQVTFCTLSMDTDI